VEGGREGEGGGMGGKGRYRGVQIKITIRTHFWPLNTLSFHYDELQDLLVTSLVP
jgi:hypothetical protein